MNLCLICKERPRPRWSRTYCKECYGVIDRRRYYKNRRKRLKKDIDRYYKNKQLIALQTGIRGKNPIEAQKRKARMMVRNGVTACRIIKQPCEVCGTTRKIHAHHEDYSKPLQVTWLCVKHHYERHRKYKTELGK